MTLGPSTPPGPGTTPGLKTPLRDVLVIPERVHQGDFVMRLSEGVGKASTLSDYVVTEQLASAFDSALGIVQRSMTDRTSRAAYLHGSFGSGKSHFMAVLHALLRGDPQARSLAGLADVVARHDAVLGGSRLLEVTFHLIGASSMEEAVLGGYLRQVRRLHPDAPLPAVHRSDAVVADARGLMGRMGADAFLAGLGGADDGWGDLGAGWTRESFEAAAAADPGSDDRRRLLSALLSTYYTAVVEGGEYREFDEGLAEISRHARSLGYDGVVLFLDELVLWLASRSADPDFVRREGAKALKLVESAQHSRPVPLVSFVARQRDLRDFLGQHMPGAEQYAFAESLRHSDDRFEVVRLEDRNLPVIAQRRLLTPRDDRGRALLDAALDHLRRRRDVLDAMLAGGQADGRTTGHDVEAFRRTYPFSPAFMGALLSLSNVLQRERTALKVMQEILVEQRGELTVSDVVPVGDLFDAVVETGAENVLGPLRERVESARRLYAEQVRPVLLARHRLTEAAGADLAALPRTHRFRSDDRLVKTVLLSAIVPETEALKGLTARRLAALNHGTVQAPIPGEEATTVLTTLRAVAEQVGEIRVGEGADPLVTVQLTNVDSQSVLDAARSADTDGARRRLVRRLVWKELGLNVDEGMYGSQQVPFVWRGRKVVVDVASGNVRDPAELRDDALLADADRWKVVVDFPFDVSDFSARDDFARVDELRARGVASRTVCWLPAFLAQARLDDLGTLTVMEEVLSSTARFEQHAANLPPGDRAQARNVIAARRDAVRERVLGVLRQAYGAAARRGDDVDTGSSRDQVFASLQPGFEPRHSGANLSEVLGALFGDMHAFSYPDRPVLGDGGEVKAAALRTVLAHATRAADHPGGRADVEPRDRPTLRSVANPLGVGQMLENHYLLDPQTLPWAQHFQRAAADAGADTGTYRVADLLRWIDEPRPRGLERPVANLVVHVFALGQGLAWYLHGGPAPTPPLDAVLTAYELRATVLPGKDDWAAARRRAEALLEVGSAAVLNARTLTELAGAVRAQARRRREACASLERRLAERAALLGLDPGAATGRLATARAASALLERLASAADDLEVVAALAGARLPTEDAKAARSISSAEGVAAALTRANWVLVGGLVPVGEDVEDVRGRAARAALEALQDVAAHEEFEARLAPALSAAETAATGVLVPARAPARPGAPVPDAPVPEAPPPAAVPDPAGRAAPAGPAVPAGPAGPAGPAAPGPAPGGGPQGPGPGLPARGNRVVSAADDLVALLDGLRLLGAGPGTRLEVSWRVVDGDG